MNLFALGLLALAMAQAAAPSPAPDPPPAPRPVTPASPAPPPERPAAAPYEYRLGPGDVIEVVVLGNADVSRTATIQTNGGVVLPLVGEVPVAQLTLTEARARIANALSNFIVNPQVEVTVKEYQSQFVTVLGEVNNPGRRPLRGRSRLIDILVDSGGFTPRASGDILITRREGSFEGGNTTMQLHIGSRLASVAEQVNLEIVLRNGDVVIVGAKAYVVVEGEVAKAGRYELEGDLTVSEAIVLAGGLTRFASNKVTIRRIDPATKDAPVLLKVDLKAIRKGKAPDIPLQAKDVVTVPRKLF